MQLLVTLILGCEVHTPMVFPARVQGLIGAVLGDGATFKALHSLEGPKALIYCSFWLRNHVVALHIGINRPLAQKVLKTEGSS